MKPLNRRGRRSTFQPMPFGRLLRLLLLALPLTLGMARGAEHSRPAPADAVSTISAPRESLPPPVHNEATCAFCQAAIFPPCAPQPTTISLQALGVVRQECAAADEATPRFTTHRLTTTRAPPTLRSA